MPFCVSLKQLLEGLIFSEGIEIEPFFWEKSTAERLFFFLGCENMGGSIFLSLTKGDGEVRFAMVASWLIRLLVMGQAALAAVAILATTALGAEITGETHTPPPPEVEDQDPVESSVPSGGSDAGGTVIDFSILPDPTDPTKMETQIFVRRTGGRDLCLRMRSDELITRSYRKRGEEPFNPSVPVRLRTQTSGQTGDLVAFNELKVFIKPHNSDYLFQLNECFVAGSDSGCFVEDLDDCDQHLEENVEVCVSRTLSGAGCTGSNHAGALDTFRKIFAANPSAVITTEAAPLETSAGEVAAAPEIGGVFEPPSEETTEAPAEAPAEAPVISEPTVIGTLPGGVLGDDGDSDPLTVVPNLIGRTESQARQDLENAFLALGVVATEGDGTVLAGFSLIKPAYAQASPQCDDSTVQPGTTCSQCRKAGEIVSHGIVVCIVLKSAFAAAPEPGMLAIFLTGLLLLLFVVWPGRTRTRDL